MVNKFSLEYDKGRFRKWLHFDGVDDYVDCSNDASLDMTTNDFTVSAFARSFGFVEAGTILSKGNWFRQIGPGYFIAYPYIPKYIFVGAYDTEQHIIQTPLGETFDWTLITMVREGNTLKAYVNTSFVGSTTITGSISNTKHLFIGKNEYNDSVFYGDIGAVFIYNRALSDAEIRELYLYVKYGVGKMIMDGLVLWLDGSSIDIENQVWKDKSGNGNDGTIYGATLQSGWVEG